MDRFIIQGGYKIAGEIDISGAKNAVLPILFASLLSQDEITIHNVPYLRDVITTQKLLEDMGVKVSDNGQGKITLQAQEITSIKAPYELVRTMRASILVLGPLLARYGEAEVSLPGGCAIGARPVDSHIKSMEALGAEIHVEDGYIKAKAKGRLQGGNIVHETVSVTGTETAIMAACLADGITTLNNAAREPEVVELANFLNSIGAKISNAGSANITIEGVPRLSGGEFTVQADRIEAGTLLTAAAITQGQIKVNNIDPNKLKAVLLKLEESGANITCETDWISLDMQNRRPHAVSLRTAPYPGFPTDMQAQLMALNTIADGVSTITETIFENRFMHVQELKRLGADITIEGHTAICRGKEQLNGAPVMATDLRASASLVLAGLAAEGETQVNRIYHLDRGYDRFEEKLSLLGAHIVREHHDVT